jgi:hypothetical protein
MNEEDMEAVEPLAGEELERMLARYARVRLEPSQAFARRARAAVMEEAWRRKLDPHSVLRASATATAADADASTVIPVRRRPFTGWSARRLGVAFTAAALAGLMLGSSVFAASRAGGPLYESRLSLESLTLPADPAARVAAELAWAEARLGEAVEAGFRHDDRAVSAALDAYGRAIRTLSTATGSAADDALAAIQLHRAVLLELAAQVPSTADGVGIALANSDRVMARLGEAGGASGSGSENNGSPQGNGFGAGDGGNAAGGAGVGRDGDHPGGTEDGADNGNAGGGAGTGGGNANGADNGAGPKPAAATPAPTQRPDPTPRPTPAPTPTPAEKPNTGPRSSDDPGKTAKPHRAPAEAATTSPTDARSRAARPSTAP